MAAFFGNDALRVIGLQLCIGAATGACFFLVGGFAQAEAALFGSAISVLGTASLARRVERAGKVAQQDPKRSIQLLYLGAAQRFALVAVLVGFGLALKLEPLALVVGLSLTQLAYMSGMHRAGRRSGT